MSLLGVDLGELDQLVSRIAAFEQHLEAADAEVDRRLGHLHACWQGAAATAHDEVQRRWSAGAAEMRAALAALRAVAAEAHTNYASAVRANLGMWS